MAATKIVDAMVVITMDDEENKLAEVLEVWEDAPLEFISKENLNDKFLRWIDKIHKEMIE